MKFLLTLLFLSCGQYNAALIDLDSNSNSKSALGTPEEPEEKEDDTTILAKNFSAPFSLEDIPPLPTHTNRDPDQKPDFFSYDCETQTSFAEYLYYERMIPHLGGNIVSPYDLIYTQDESGFDKYLQDVGVVHFKANEVIQSNHPNHLRTCGLKNLLPPKNCWMRSATLLLMADKIRRAINFPLSIESHYRPVCYNKLIGGATKSDHIIAKAVDLVPFNKENLTEVERFNLRKKMQASICDEFWFDPALRVSAGFGYKKVHLGIDSPRQRTTLGRVWTYPAYWSDLTDPQNPIRFLRDGSYSRCFYNENDILKFL